MKSKKYILPILLITLFIQCKKDKDGNNAARCSIRMINYLGNVYAYTFDNQGRVLTMNTTEDPLWNANYAYTYSADSIILIATRNNKLWKKTTAPVNAGGLPVSSITAEFNYQSNSPIPIAHADSVHVTYEYNPEGKLVKMVSKKDNMPAQTFTWNWINGNIVSDSRGVNFTYYSDKPAQDGDGFSFQELWPNIDDPNPKLVFHKNRNLLKSTGSGGNIFEFRYEMNTQGNIVVINDAIIVGHLCQ